MSLKKLGLGKVNHMAEENVSNKVDSREVKIDKKSKEEMKNDSLKRIESEENKVEETMYKIKYNDLTSSRYKVMDSYVDMVLLKIAYAAIITGRGGTGKTFRVCNFCNKAGVKFKYLNNFVTPQQLYIKCYEYREEPLVIIDDVANFFSDIKNLSLLKAITWDNVGGGLREVSYETTKPMTDMYGRDVPRKFFTNSRYVIITNKIPSSKKLKEDIDAVLTRVNVAEVELEREDLLEVFNQIVSKGYSGLAHNECMEVFEYLRDNTSDNSEDLNLRTLFKMFQFRLLSKLRRDEDFWKQLSNNILNKDPLLVIVHKLVEDNNFVSEKDRIEEFKRITHKSRATYFVLKDKLGVKKKRKDDEVSDSE